MKYLLLIIVILSSIISIITPQEASAQENPIPYQLPFLLYDEDARVAGFGSIASVADDYYVDAGFYSNPALLSRRKKTLGINVCYNPMWEKSKHFNVNIFYSLNKNNVLAFHFKKFYTHDQIVYIQTLWENQTTYVDIIDLNFKFSYAHHFKNGLSIGSSMSFIQHEQIGIPPANVKSGRLGFGLGLNYDRLLYRTESFELPFSFGFCTNNLGSDVSNFNWVQNDFYPAIIAFGAMLSPTFQINKKTRMVINLAYEAEKLLVPTPTIPDTTEWGWAYWEIETNPDTKLWQYYLRSFSDAPHGAKEEWQEIIHSYAIEIRWEAGEHFSYATRGGFYKEPQNKRGVEYYTLGASVSLYGITLNYSRYFSKNNNQQIETWFLQLGYSYNL